MPAQMADGTPQDEAHDVELVWWLVRMGLEDRETYRRLRALAWDLVVAHAQNSESPKKSS